MIEGWVLWLFLVGLAVGILTSLLLVLRLPRGEADVTEEERPAEAAWISSIIERHGGVAPRLLVEEVLGLHQAYLERRRPPDANGASQALRPPTPPVPPVAPPGYSRMPAPPQAVGPVPGPPGSGRERDQRPG